ncbi:hypothetical protein FOCC_FOCC013564 [Frankliniella occidentalis]|nr:hypothetical protein FOCC_FOCC013564 [Frankliniella occidentalis]
MLSDWAIRRIDHSRPCPTSREDEKKQTGNRSLQIAAPEQGAPPPLSVLSKCDACAAAPCQHGGQCLSRPQRSFECACAAGYHGAVCQHVIDACFGNPCRNQGTCVVLEEGRFR